MFATRHILPLEFNTSLVRSLIVRSCTKALDGVVEVYHLAALPACGRDARATFMPSIVAAQKSCSRRRANAASRDFCTAQPSRFFSDHIRTPSRVPGDLRSIKCL